MLEILGEKVGVSTVSSIRECKQGNECYDNLPGYGGGGMNSPNDGWDELAESA